MVEPASLASGSPGRGGHVWKLLPQSISKVQVLKYLSRAELHPCGGPSEHSSCTLKGYSESRAWGGYTLKSMGVPLTEWLSAECNGSPLIYCQYVGQGAFDKVCFKKKKEKEKLIFKFDTADSKKEESIFDPVAQLFSSAKRRETRVKFHQRILRFVFNIPKAAARICKHTVAGRRRRSSRHGSLLNFNT